MNAPRRMPFGKYRGELLEDLPTDYLEWLGSLQLREPLRSHVEAEHARRYAESTTVAFPHVGLANQIITAGYRALALRLHPDAGGDHDSMVALSRAREWLSERAGT